MPLDIAHTNSLQVNLISTNSLVKKHNQSVQNNTAFVVVFIL